MLQILFTFYFKRLKVKTLQAKCIQTTVKNFIMQRVLIQYKNQPISNTFIHDKNNFKFAAIKCNKKERNWKSIYITCEIRR